MDDLAGVLQYQGKYEAAEELNRRAMDGMDKVLEKEHLDTLMRSLLPGLLTSTTERIQYKAELYERACIGYKKVRGSGHPTTIACDKHYSFLLQETKY